MAVYLKPDKIETWNGVKVNKYFLTEHNDYNIFLPVDKLFDVSAITVHNTDMIKVNNATTPAEQYTRATKYGNMAGVVVHFYVDHKGAWWNMPLDMVTWHSGDGVNGRTGNNTSISIECIMDNTNASYNQKSMDNAARLAAYLIKKFNLSVETGLVTHTYWLNKMKKNIGDKNTLCTIPPKPEYDYNKNKWTYYKTCPLYIIQGKGWNYFEKLTTEYYNKLNKNTEIYRIRLSKDNSKSQIGAYSNLETAKKIAEYNRGYKVFNSNGVLVYKPRQYYAKYITTRDKVSCKNTPTREAPTIKWLNKKKEVVVYLGTDTKASNGTIWVKCIYKNDDVWLPLKYLRKE